MTDDELLRAALEVLQRRAAGDAGQPSLTVQQLFSTYEASRRRRGGRSWVVTEIRLRPFVEAHADRDVMSLKVVDWSDHRARREETEIPTGRPGRRYCAHTLNQELQVLKTMLNTGVAQGRIPFNPLALAKAVKTVSKRRTAPKEHEVGELLEERDPRKRYIVLAAADAGLRRNEMRLLQHDWIDRDEMAIHLDESCTKGHKPRATQLTQRLLDAIDALPRHLRSRLVLHNEHGEAYNQNTLSLWFRRLADATTVQAAPRDRRVRLHDMRHGFATNSARRGVPIDVIQLLLGHSSLATTQLYVERSSADIPAAREAFERGIERDQRRGPQKAPANDAVLPNQQGVEK